MYGLGKVEIYFEKPNYLAYLKPGSKHKIKLQCYINLPEGMYIKDVRKSGKIKVSFSKRNLRISEITLKEFLEIEKNIFFVDLAEEQVKKENIILQEEILTGKRKGAEKISLKIMRRIFEKEIKLLRNLHLLVEIHAFECVIYEDGKKSSYFLETSSGEFLEKVRKELRAKIAPSEFEEIIRKLENKLEIKSRKSKRKRGGRKISFKYFPASELDKITGIFKLGGNALEDEAKLYE